MWGHAPHPNRPVLGPYWGSRALAAIPKFTARDALAAAHEGRKPSFPVNGDVAPGVQLRPVARPAAAAAERSRGVRCSARMSRRRAASLALVFAALLFRLGLAFGMP